MAIIKIEDYNNVLFWLAEALGEEEPGDIKKYIGKAIRNLRIK